MVANRVAQADPLHVEVSDWLYDHIQEFLARKSDAPVELSKAMMAQALVERAYVLLRSLPGTTSDDEAELLNLVENWWQTIGHIKSNLAADENRPITLRQ